MKRAFLCSLLALTGIAVAAPSANPPPDEIKAGVHIGNVRVGGLTAEPARAKVKRSFARTLRLHFQGDRWRVSPKELGATISAGDAVTRALYARPGGRVKLRVKINRERLRAYVARLDEKLSQPAENAQVIGLTSGYQPIISDGKPGLRVDRERMAARIARALREGKRKPLALAVDWVQPDVTSANYGPVIVIKRDSHQLLLYNGTSPWRTFSVATGQAQYPTPTGVWSIVNMQENPWWIPPPNSDWAKGLKPVPPGPGNPLGTRWMGLSASGVGIHATPDDASIGYSASHGCIRMHLPDAEWLYGQVHVGTPVYIVSA